MLIASRARFWAVLLMIASGFAALGLQIVWTQQCASWLGAEAAAVLAVVAAFFGGLAVGSLLIGPRVETSARPAWWYAACEAVVGIWGLALVFVMPSVSPLLSSLIGTQPSPWWQWSVVFGATFVVLLPATAAMGATLPAMEQILAAARARGATIAWLYAGNTAGAVLGVLAAAFFLVPRLGMQVSAAVCASTSLACAVLALKVFAPLHASRRPESRRPVNVRHHLSVLALTGFLGIGYEVLVVRVLSQVAENTVFTFAILLAVYLIGSALGAAAYGRWGAASAWRREHLLQAMSAACLLGILAMTAAGSIKSAGTTLLGAGFGIALGIEAALAAAAFLVPTFFMGALFSQLASAARADGVDFGRALGVNTLGAALAPLAFGVVLLPRLGAAYALLLVAAGYLLINARRGWRSAPQWAVAGALVALAIWEPGLARVEIPAGGRLVSYAEGVNAAVSVVEDGSGVATLHINNRQQEGSSATLFADARQGLLPILLHPAPRRTLFLGLGTGLTAKSASEDADLQVDAVELLPEVVRASRHFAAGESQHPRLHLFTADARRFVRATAQRYDVIVADNFHPARSGSGTLYTVEHFAAVRQRLAPGGVFCQWLPLHQLDLGTLRSVVRSYNAVFPRGWMLLATNSLETPVLGLVARRDGERFEYADLRSRLATARLPRSPQEFGIPDELALLGGFIAGPGALARFAGDVPLNTDDRPFVSYHAPRITYAPDSTPRDRLFALLEATGISPGELLTGSDESWRRRLAAYWSARDRYLAAGRNVRSTPRLADMLAQVRAPLLSVLEISPDFRPAYDPLVRMAAQLADSDAEGARSLLVQLMVLQPARPEARDILRAMTESAQTR